MEKCSPDSGEHDVTNALVEEAGRAGWRRQRGFAGGSWRRTGTESAVLSSAVTRQMLIRARAPPQNASDLRITHSLKGNKQPCPNIDRSLKIDLNKKHHNDIDREKRSSEIKSAREERPHGRRSPKGEHSQKSTKKQGGRADSQPSADDRGTEVRGPRRLWSAGEKNAEIW